MKWRVLLLCAVALTGCQRVSDEKARELVERYNRVVSEAYRRGDVKLIDTVVGPSSKDGKRLTGLIGVRLDMGLTLDAQLLSLEITSVERSEDDVRVRTKERWRYRDLKIGSGEQVGAESLDSYEMLYLFQKVNKAWLLDEIQFTAAPQVGREAAAYAVDARTMHGFATPKEEAGKEKP